MTEPNPAHELLAMLGKMIADEEAKVMELTQRRTYHSDPDIDRWISREWSEFRLRVEPMRKQQEYILKQLAQIEACKPPKPMVVTVEEADRMGLPRCP